MSASGCGVSHVRADLDTRTKYDFATTGASPPSRIDVEGIIPDIVLKIHEFQEP